MKTIKNIILLIGLMGLTGASVQAQCGSPTGLSVSGITASEATVSWAYDTALSPVSFVLTVTDTTGGNPPLQTTLASDIRSYTLTGLDERTVYRLDLTTDCSGSDTLTTQFATPCVYGGEIAVGDEIRTSTIYPITTNSKYSISQQIFKAQEVEDVDTLLAIKVWYNPSVARDRVLDVYLDTVSFASFQTQSDYIAQGTAQRHFSGTVHFMQGWVEIALQTPFVLPAGKNLLLTVHDHSNATGGNRAFRVHRTSETALLFGNSNTAFSPDNHDEVVTVIGNNNPASERNNIVFVTPCFNPGCPPPDNLEATPSVTSVELQWTADAGSHWRVEYRQADDVAYTVAAGDITENHYTVAGLQPATDYAFRVINLCDAGAGSRSRSRVDVTTLCATYTLPFTEGFSDFTAPYTYDPLDFEKCWTRMPGQTTPHTDNGTLRFNVGAYPEKTYMVLPRMSVPVDSLYIELFCTPVSGSGRPWQLEVGVATDPDDTSTFIAVDTVTTGLGDTATHVVLLDSYNGPDGHLYLRAATANGRGSIDSLVVNRIPACRHVTTAHVTNITPHTISLATGTTEYSGYTLYWGTGTDLASATDSLATTDTSLVLTGLQSNTTYNLWIRGHCGTETGVAVALHPVRTLCEAVSVSETTPWYTGFEAASEPCTWSLYNPACSWVPRNNAVEGATGIAMIGLTAVDTYSMLVLPTFDFSALTGNAEAVFYHNVYAATDEPSRMYYRADTTGSWTLLVTFDTSEQNIWQRSYIELPNSQGAANYQVAFKVHTAEGERAFMLDAFRVRALSACREVENVIVRDITERTATVAWTGSSPSYKVQFRRGDENSWSQLNVVGEDSLVLAPLEMNTQYMVRVTGVCTLDDETDPSEIVSFTTELCSNRNDRDNYGTGSDTVSHVLVPTYSWYGLTEILIDSAELAGMTTVEGFMFTTLSGAGGMQMRATAYMWHTTDTVLTEFLPQTADATVVHQDDGLFMHMSYSEAGTHAVNFTTPFVWDGHSNVVFALKKTYFNSPLDTASFAAHLDARQRIFYGAKPSGTINMYNPNTSFTTAQCSGSNIVPNLTFFGCIPQCYAPVVHTVSATTGSVTVRWYNEGHAVQIEIKEASDSWEENAVTDTNFHHTFSYLPDGTAYDIRLRHVCDAEAGDYSDWTVVHVSTLPLCSEPTALAASNIGASTATLGWTDGPVTDGHWEAHVWTDNGFDRYYDLTSNPATLDGLRPNQSYHAQVRSVCGPANYSDWSEAMVFDNICHPATGVRATPNGTTVTVRWAAGERNQRWIVTYGYAGYERNQRLGYQVVDTNVAVISGLAAGHSYGFRVVAVCGDDWQAGWTGAEVTATVSAEGIDAVDGSSVYLYPNPASHSVTIGGLEGENTVTVVDMNGRESGKWKVESGEFTIDLSGYAKGAYFVRITGEHTAVRKLVVK